MARRSEPPRSASSEPKGTPPPLVRRRSEGFVGSLLHAVEGVLHTIVHQRNMKVHMVSAILVGLVGSGIALDLAAKVTLIFCVLMVFFAEILNTAFEALVDLHTDDYDDRARVAKDAAAAGVLVLSIGTVVIFLAVLVTNWTIIAAAPPMHIGRQVAAGVPLATLAGLLMAAWRRPGWVDWLLTAAGVGLLALLATWTTSAVFTAMTASLFAGASAAAHRRRTAR